MEKFKISDRIEIVCESQKTRYGFRHLATLFIDGNEREKSKCCYYNRTWESYEFQSVLFNVVDKAFKNKILNEQEKSLCDDFIREGKQARERIKSDFKTIGMIAGLGNIFANTQKESNDWKARMLKAGLGNSGLVMPNDWDTLDEKTKETRLNAVISELNKAGN